MPQYSFTISDILKSSLCIVLILKGVIVYKQNDYILDTERAEVISYNQNYVSFAAIHNFKFNRTHVGINGSVSIKINMGFDVKAMVQGYKFASNEYRGFPMEFSRNGCTMFAENEFGVQDIYLYGNFRGCPILKGHRYFFINYTPDYSKFPPYIPGGRYMVDVKLMYSNIEVFEAQMFATVKPIKYFFPWLLMDQS